MFVGLCFVAFTIIVVAGLVLEHRAANGGDDTAEWWIDNHQRSLDKNWAEAVASGEINDPRVRERLQGVQDYLDDLRRKKTPSRLASPKLSNEDRTFRKIFIGVCTATVGLLAAMAFVC